MDDIFNKMVATIAGKRSWHEDRESLYDGSHRASMIKISKDRRVESQVRAALDWPRTAVDFLVSDCTFDAFSGDDFGATRMLVEAGGDEAILSAETNATLGAVSFVAILPRENGYPLLVPFSGAEATGIKDARGSELSYGLAAKKRENGIVTEWLFFQRGRITVLDSSGSEIDSVDLEVDAMPFVQFTYEPDLASRPFGRSRLSKASINIMNSALRGIGLSEQVSLINLLKADLLLVQGEPDDMTGTAEQQTSVGSLKTLFFNGLDLNGVRLEQMSQLELKEIEKGISRAAMQYASSMGMSPTMFGEQPSNGAFSEGSLKQMQKPYKSVLNRARMSFGESIRLLAVELYKIVAKTEDVSGLDSLETVFLESLDVQSLGAIGDSLQKISSAMEALNPDFSLPESTFRSILGIPLRPQVINQSYPSFEAAEERFKGSTLTEF